MLWKGRFGDGLKRLEKPFLVNYVPEFAPSRGQRLVGSFLFNIAAFGLIPLAASLSISFLALLGMVIENEGVKSSDVYWTAGAFAIQLVAFYLFRGLGLFSQILCGRMAPCYGRNFPAFALLKVGWQYFFVLALTSFSLSVLAVFLRDREVWSSPVFLGRLICLVIALTFPFLMAEIMNDDDWTESVPPQGCREPSGGRLSEGDGK